MSSYRDILASPAGKLMMLTGIARLGWGVEGLALIVLIEAETGSYATAGLAVGALGVTSGVLAPLRGRLIDRRGRGVLVAMGVLNGVFITAIALDPSSSGVGYVVLAALAGAVPPPFTAWIRAGLANRLQGAELHRVYAVDNIFEESAFVLGPLLAGLVIAFASASAALILSVVLVLIGVVALSLPASMPWAPPRRAASGGPRKPLNRPLLLTIGSLAGLGGGVGFAEIAIVGFAEGEGRRPVPGSSSPRFRQEASPVPSPTALANGPGRRGGATSGSCSGWRPASPPSRCPSRLRR